MSLKACGVILVTGEPIAKFLLMVHADRYDLPKGHIEPGETEVECALREMEEETGIPRSLVRLDTNFRHEFQYEVSSRRTQFKTVPKTTVIFLGYLPIEVPIQITEHQGFEWFPWSPPRPIQAQAIDPLLEHLRSYLDSAST